MARRPNPYYMADSGRYAPVGQGLTNLASVFMSTPDAAKTAQTEALAWQARGARQEQAMQRENRQEMDRLANLFELYDPATHDNRQVLATGIRAGMEQGDIADLFRTAAGNLEGMTDEQRAGALVGTGETLGENDAVSIARQDRLRGENQAADLSGLSRDELLANIFLTQGADAADKARGVLYNPPAPRQDQHWLNMTRQAQLEEEVVAELNALAADLGLPEGTPIPPELRGKVVPESMELIRSGGQTPRAAVAQTLRKYNPRAAGQGWFFDGSPRVEYDAPAAAAPTPSAGGLPAQDENGWTLEIDAQGNRAYVSPDRTQYREIQ